MQMAGSIRQDYADKPMGRIFVELALRGKNEWWRYLLSLLLILFAGAIIGSIPMAMLVAAATRDGDPGTYFDPSIARVVGIDPTLNYIGLHLSLVVLLIAVCVAVRLIHKRGALTLVTVRPYLSWKRIGQGFGLFFVLVSAEAALGYVREPASYAFTLDLGKFLLFLPFALVLTPLQAAAEELLFRGYLLQGLGLLLRRPPLLAVASAIVFLLPHLVNPEMTTGPVVTAGVYFGWGLFLALVTLRDNACELAIGVHAANNLFQALFVNYRGSAIASHSMVTLRGFNPLGSLLSLIVMAVVFYLVIFGRRKRRAPDTPEAGV